MSVPTTSWSELTPAGGDQINAGDNRIREMKTQVREVIDVDHNFPSSGQSTTTGFHNQVTLIEAADIGTGAEGYPILGAQTINSKPELVYTDEDDNDIQITKAGVLKPSTSTVLADWSAIMELVYPVGHIYISYVSTNPGTLLGVGTWSAFAAGRVLVGLDGTNAAFDTVGETGGVETVTLTAEQSGLPAHAHPLTGGDSDSFGPYIDASNNTTGTLNNTGNATAANAAEAHTNLQPYITVFMWRRVS